MAAGRCDSWMRDFHYFKKECDVHRNGYHDAGLSPGRLQQGGWSNSSGRSDGGCRQDKAFIQEYVGLLGGGRSNNAFSFHSRARDGEFPKSETEILRPLAKKRKFSPIVWDREDEEIRISLKNRIVPKCSPLCSPMSVHKSSEKVQNVDLDEDVIINPVTPIQHHVATVYTGVDSSESPADSHALLHSEQFQDKEQELVYEVEEYIEARNISTSRWIHMENSPSEILSDDVEDMSIRRNVIHHVNSLKAVSSRVLLSPESGEFWKEGSGGSREKSSQSNGMYSMGPESPENGDESSENDLDNHNFMSIDDTLDEHAEDDDNSRRIQQPTGIKHRRINMLEGCRSVFEYEKLNKINEGTYGIVYRARDKKTGEVVALKKVKMGVERNDGFPLSSLREINILLSLHHPSIVDVKEVVMGDLDSVFMAMEYMEHDLKGLMEVMKQPFSQSEVKCLMLQLLEGVKYLHDNWVLHRDLKTSNLLLNNSGELKICDFGLSRQYGSPLKPYTPLVVTLWYRAPELLLETKQYSTAIDMWSVGCIMAELLAKEPLFSGRTKFDQLDKIFRTLGTPNETIWPGFSKLPGVAVNFAKQQYNMLRKKFPAASFTGSPVLSDLGLDLLNRLLTYDPDKRITAEAALNHGWFREVPLPKSREFMPTFPAQHVQNGMTCSHRAF